MNKGVDTRTTILEHALRVATRVGLEGLSIGGLSADLGLSKSGLFAHFGSKEKLHLAVVEHATSLFVERVVRPGLAASRGEPRVRRLFECWLSWGTGPAGDSGGRLGCFFVTAAVELDDREGPARDRLVAVQQDWLDLLANAVRMAIFEGHFAPDCDPEQFVFEAYGVILGAQHALRLMRQPAAPARALAAFDHLIIRSRAK